MRGTLIYLMGPSGAGKDALLSAVRRAGVPGVLVAHRYITRPPAPGENHIALDAAEFALRLHHHLFALHWQAHRYHYAIGVEIDCWLAQGLTVIVNGSRAHLAQARRRYAESLLPICLTVSRSTLEQRLTGRGRENPQQIAERLQRASEAQRLLPKDCVLLANDGALSQTLAAFTALINRG